MQRHVLTILLAAALVCAAAYAFEWMQVTYFAHVLSIARVQENVSRGTESYTVNGGAVYGTEGNVLKGLAALAPLKLAYEKTLARRNPILAIAGSDPDRLLVEIDRLRKAQVERAAAQTSPRDTTLVRTSLYPIDFLTSTAKLEKTRLAFLSSGSDADAGVYETQLDETIRKYQMDIAAFESAFKEAVPGTAKKYATPTRVISRDDILSALDSLQKNVHARSISISLRQLCTRGLLPACSSSDLAFAPALELPPAIPTTPSARANANMVKDVVAAAHGPVEISGTLVSLSSSECTPRGKPELFWLSGTNPPFYLGDLTLVDTATTRSIPFYKYFADRGIRYTQYDLLVFYKCFAFARDYAAALTTRNISDFAQHSPISAYASQGQVFELRVLEHSLSSNVLNEHDALAYLSASQKLSTRGVLTADLQNSIATLSLEAASGSAGIDEAVGAIARTETVNQQLVLAGVPEESSADYLFYTRSGFETLFLMDNASATGAHPPLFPANDFPEKNRPYISLSSLAHSTTTTAAILHDLQFWYRLHKI